MRTKKTTPKYRPMKGRHYLREASNKTPNHLTGRILNQIAAHAATLHLSHLSPKTRDPAPLLEAFVQEVFSYLNEDLDKEAQALYCTSIMHLVQQFIWDNRKLRFRPDLLSSKNSHLSGKKMLLFPENLEAHRKRVHALFKDFFHFQEFQCFTPKAALGEANYNPHRHYNPQTALYSPLRKSHMHMYTFL